MEQGLSEKLQQRRRSKMLQLQELNQAVNSSFKNYKQLDTPISNEEEDETKMENWDTSW